MIPFTVISTIMVPLFRFLCICSLRNFTEMYDRQCLFNFCVIKIDVQIVKFNVKIYSKFISPFACEMCKSNQNKVDNFKLKIGNIFLVLGKHRVKLGYNMKYMSSVNSH